MITQRQNSRITVIFNLLKIGFIPEDPLLYGINRFGITDETNFEAPFS